MLEALAMYSDELMELLLAEEEVPEELIHQVIATAVVGSRTSRPSSGIGLSATRACSRCWTR